MRGTGIIGLVGAGVLSACAAPPGGGGGGDVRPAAVPVTVEGAGFAADLRPGPAGERLTSDGAVPTRGLAVAVRREGGAALDYSEGRIAKAAAEAACRSAGGRFDAAAIGRYSGAGTWTFNGACA